MSRRHHLDTALATGTFSWADAVRQLRTPRRRHVLGPALREMLVTTPTRFLPHLRNPSTHERGASRVRQTGDPLSVYWADLRRLRPTQRDEEFVLAHAIEILREAIAEILGERPSAQTRAIAAEYLSPYSKLRKAWDEQEVGDELKSDQIERLRQRLGELTQVQSVLIERNLHAVPATARKYRHVGVPWEDLIQEGNASLLRAVERFNPAEGVRFSSYASWWIQQGILKALSFQSRTVRLPVYLAQAVHRVRDAQASCPESLTLEDLAQRTALSSEHVERALRADRNCVSLQRPAIGSEEDEGTMSDRLPDPRQAPEPDAASPAELRQELESLLNALPEREALVLRLRFGLEDGRAWTLEEVRQRLGISRERVRQLQAQSLGRLTRPTPRRRLSRYLDGVSG
jgi:RNA polymerase primary sigma factor